MNCYAYLRILNHLKSNLPSLNGKRAPCMRMASTSGGANAHKSSMLHMLMTIRVLFSASYSSKCHQLLMALHILQGKAKGCSLSVKTLLFSCRLDSKGEV